MNDFSSEISDISSEQDWEEDSHNSDSFLSNLCSESYSDDSFQSDDNELIWKNFNRQKYNDQLPMFDENVGCAKNILQLKKPIEFFEIFFDDKLLQEICDFTNHYQQLNQTHIKKSHHKQYVELTTQELKLYLGIILFMGIVQQPELVMYWQKKNFHLQSSLTKIMTYERFLQIKTNLHFSKPHINSRDPNYKTKRLAQVLIMKFQQAYSPERYLSIDESMIKFTGRNKMKVYMPSKPIRYGFKAFILAESQSGYVLNWLQYDGKSQSLLETVKFLTNNYENKGYHLSFDRYYTSIQVVRYLNQQQFGFLGAAMQNRLKLTQEIKDTIQKLEKYQSKYYISQDGLLLLSIWRDQKLVIIISNHGSKQQTEVTRKVASSKIKVLCPTNIYEYQQTAKGVDLLDQMIQYYYVRPRSKKWYTSVFNHLLQISVYNSFILFQKVVKNQQNLLKFSLELIKTLFNEKLGETKYQQPIKTIKSECQLNKGFLVNCQICPHSTKLKKKTTYICQTHSIALCAIPCYDFHRNNLNLQL